MEMICEQKVSASKKRQRYIDDDGGDEEEEVKWKYASKHNECSA